MYYVSCLFFSTIAMKRFALLALTAPIFLVACSPKDQDAAADKLMEDRETLVVDLKKGMQQDGDHMMQTAALQEGCDALTAKSTEEKTAILKDLAHNMDPNGLDMILGKDCAFLGEVAHVVDLTGPAVRISPTDIEMLYFSPETNHFIASCSAMNAVGYVLEKQGDMNPYDYFYQNLPVFEAVAGEARSMVEMMGDMDNMEGMEHTDDMDNMEGMEHMDGMDGMDDMGGMEGMENEGGEDQAMASGQYTAYTDGVIGNGEPAVLFFYATWCPACQANDARLQEWYGAEQLPVTTYKIDYDNSSDLKSRYGVVQQDTFVRIDGNGDAQQTTSFPDETSLRDIING